MKSILRAFFINLAALYLLSRVVTGFTYTGGFETLILAAMALTGINMFVKPLVKLFFLPLNILTLGLFSWVVNAGMIYLLTLVVPKIKIVPWQFSGFSYQGFIIPSLSFNFLTTLALCALIVSFISFFLNWLAR